MATIGKVKINFKWNKNEPTTKVAKQKKNKKNGKGLDWGSLGKNMNYVCGNQDFI